MKRKNLSDDQVNDEYDCDIAVIITCYNHSKYIGQAIESVIKQRINVSWKVFIHDDASTDGSQAIVQYYQDRYPDLIQIVLQTENQMSRGVNPWLDTVFPITRSRYVALLEGDDYWNCESKLEAQYNAMEQNRDIALCFHEALMLKSDVLDIGTNIYPKYLSVVSINEIIKYGGSYARTATLFFRSSEITSDFISHFRHAPVGDRGLQIFLSNKVGALFVPKITSVYRVASVGSWTNTVYAEDRAAHRLAMTKFYKYVCKFDKQCCLEATKISMKENFKFSLALASNGKFIKLAKFWFLTLKTLIA